MHSQSVRIVSLDSTHEFLQNGKFWAYAVNGHHMVIGAASLNSSREWGWINDLFVKPAFRRLGIARRLVQFLIGASIQGNGVLGCCAGISVDDAPSQQLFQSLGFAHVGLWSEGVRLFIRRHQSDDPDSMLDL